MPFTLTLSEAPCPGNAEEEEILVRSLEETIKSTLSDDLQSNERLVKTTVTVQCLQQRKLHSAFRPRNLVTNSSIKVYAVNVFERLCGGLSCDNGDIVKAEEMGNGAAEKVKTEASSKALEKNIQKNLVANGLGTFQTAIIGDPPFIEEYVRMS